MNRNDLEIFVESIDFELGKIRNNEAYINNKSYFGLDKELLSYIRKLEQALDEIEKYMTSYIKVEDRNENVKIEFNELLKIIQKAKGDVKNENNNV